MAKRRKPRASNQPRNVAAEPHFSAVEEEFFRTGDSLHEMPAAFEPEERPSLWRRLFARAA